MRGKDGFREKIIDVSQIIFNKFGYKKTTMDEIAHALNKGKSSLYYYFKSKDEIFEAVIEKEAFLLINEISLALADQTNAIEKIKTYVTIRMGRIGEMTNFYAALNNEYLDHIEFIESFRQKSNLEEISRVKILLDEGVAQHQFDIQDTELASIAIVTALKGLEVPFLLFKSQDQLNQRLDNLLHVLFFGIIQR
jgi:AcrR family transcriptional regulator